MSVLLHVKNTIVAHLNLPTEVKKRVNNVLNSIDTDLDIVGYETSIETDKAIDELESILTEMRASFVDEDEDKDANLALERPRRRIPSDDDDNNDEG